jgi:hypothetical protein
MQILAHGSLDDLGNEIQAITDSRRILLEMIAVIRLSDLIDAQPLSLIERVRHWHNVVRGCLAQLVDEIDDSRQFFDCFGRLIVGQPESRQRRNVLNLIFIE